MSSRTLRVLVSSWAVSELRWNDGWTWQFERARGALSDAEVVSDYGDEAFRRRDALLASGDSTYAPGSTELIGRRVMTALRDAGWTIEADTHRLFIATQHARRLTIDGVFNATLTITGDGHAHTTSDLGAAERWLLTTALPAERLAALTDIISLRPPEPTEQ